MNKLLAKLTVAVILLVFMRQYTPPTAAYSLRPLSNAEKSRSFRLSPGHGLSLIAPTALREIRVFRLSEGVPVVNAHEYILDNSGAGLQPVPLEINSVLAMIEAAARAEVARCVENRLLPAQDAWQEKAVAAIVMSSLPSIRQSLGQTFPHDTIDAFIGNQTAALESKLRTINTQLDLPEDDFGFARLRTGAIIPMPRSIPAVSADSSGAI